MAIRAVLCWLSLAIFPGLCAAAEPALLVKELDFGTATLWVDTGIDCQPGDTLRITATGNLTFPSSKTNGPEGLSRGWRDLLRILPINDAGRGALIGRIGSTDASRPFLIGPRREQTVSITGRFFVGINALSNEPAEGSYHVKVERVPVSASPAAAEAASLKLLSQSLLDQLPPRVSDPDGTPGDRVNFMLVGTEEKVKSALLAAGWVTVDRSVKDAVVRGAIASFSKQAYTTLPMSELQLFGRGQDYGWAQGDPLRVVASRHHFRIWKAPFTWNDQPVWVGAGTHDIGFDRDQRNNKITHKIDPQIDGERDYIGRSLFETGNVLKLDYMTPKETVKEAKTAHGETFFSDGRTLVVYFKADTDDLSKKFADLFCSVLKQKNPDTGEWGACSQYLDGTGREDVALAPIRNDYRLLIVPGILSSCVADTAAYAEGQESLRNQYGVSVELLQVPNNSSEDNARMISEYLKDRFLIDRRPYIVVGYSKGAPDVQVALAKEEGVAGAVAAFVTVAGASGGSPIADLMPAQAEKWISAFQLKGCQGDLAQGFKSLARSARQAFLASYPKPLVPTYSIVAKSGKTNTSKALLQSWQLLTAFDAIQDGQLTRQDAVVPGAKFLGTALGDHFAVALPFDKSSDASIRTAMDQTRFPRAALLESIVRFVEQDLPNPASPAPTGR